CYPTSRATIALAGPKCPRSRRGTAGRPRRRCARTRGAAGTSADERLFRSVEATHQVDAEPGLEVVDLLQVVEQGPLERRLPLLPHRNPGSQLRSEEPRL